jgi:hypothetical protein
MAHPIDDFISFQLDTARLMAAVGPGRAHTTTKDLMRAFEDDRETGVGARTHEQEAADGQESD